MASGRWSALPEVLSLVRFPRFRKRLAIRMVGNTFRDEGGREGVDDGGGEDVVGEDGGGTVVMVREGGEYNERWRWKRSAEGR